MWGKHPFLGTLGSISDGRPGVTGTWKDSLFKQFSSEGSYASPAQSAVAGWDGVWGSLNGLKKGWQKQAKRENPEAEPPEDQPEPGEGLPDDGSDLPDADDDPTAEAPGDEPDADGDPDPEEPGDDEPAPSPADPEELTNRTEAIQSSYDGQIIENIDLYVASGDAIRVTHDDVTIRNVRVFHEDGNGINVRGASNVTIEQVEVVHASPPNGIDPSVNTQQVNIRGYDAPNLTINDVVVRDGSSGIYLTESPGAEISNVEGYNFHGPYPRGQFVQFNKSGDSSLTDFYAFNDPANSRPEDIISVYHSPGVTISDGLIDGNNSRSGVGVMFEGESQGGRVHNVDTINQGNGAFSSYSDDVEFHSTRSFDNVYEDQGRGLSSSNALIWNVSSDGVSIFDSSYTNPGNPNNIAWDLSRADVAQIYEDPDATPSTPVSADVAWM